MSRTPAPSVTLEWLCPHAAILRMHGSPDATIGDPYLWWTVVKLHPDAGIEIKGADRPLPPGGARALCDALAVAGFRRRIHTRVAPDGTTRVVAKPL